MGSKTVWQTITFCITAFALAGFLDGCSTDSGTGQPTGDVQSRAVAQAPQPMPSSSSGQPATQLPTFPQPFDVQGPETKSLGFAVTQPGPIVVDVQGQGAPVIVTLQSSGSQPITQQATGNLRLNYNVTPQDVQKSIFWLVQIRLAQPMPPQQGGRATGSVNVQYPPVNQAAVQQAVQTVSAQRRQPTDQEKAQAAVQSKARMDGAFQAHKAQFEQQRQQRHAALMAPLQPILTKMQAQTGGAISPRGLEESQATDTSSTPEAVSSRAVRSRGVEEAPAGETPPVPGEADVTSRAVRSRGVEEPGASETPSAAGDDVTSRGLYGGSLLVSPKIIMPNPAITSLGVAKGQPGDPVLITGSGFGSGAGEVHFIIGQGQGNDVISSGQAWWSDTQILANVPDASGVMAYNGYLYIVRSSDKAKSPLIPFRFEPALELRIIMNTTDRILQWPVEPNNPPSSVEHANGNPFTGYNNNDVLFNNTRLTNGWLTDDSFVYCGYYYGSNNYLYNCQGGAYIYDTKKGTNWPYLNVRWWVGAGSIGGPSVVDYSYGVHIIGPKGVPDGVVCTQTPCPSN